MNHITSHPRPCRPISANVQYTACTLRSFDCFSLLVHRCTALVPMGDRMMAAVLPRTPSPRPERACSDSMRDAHGQCTRPRRCLLRPPAQSSDLGAMGDGGQQGSPSAAPVHASRTLLQGHGPNRGSPSADQPSSVGTHRTCGQAWPAQPLTSPCVQGCARQPLRRERSGECTQKTSTVLGAFHALVLKCRVEHAAMCLVEGFPLPDKQSKTVQAEMKNRSS